VSKIYHPATWKEVKKVKDERHQLQKLHNGFEERQYLSHDMS